eukprot:523992_1
MTKKRKCSSPNESKKSSKRQRKGSLSDEDSVISSTEQSKSAENDQTSRLVGLFATQASEFRLLPSISPSAEPTSDTPIVSSDSDSSDSDSSDSDSSDSDESDSSGSDSHPESDCADLPESSHSPEEDLSSDSVSSAPLKCEFIARPSLTRANSARNCANSTRGW